MNGRWVPYLSPAAPPFAVSEGGELPNSRAKARFPIAGPERGPFDCAQGRP